VRKNTGGTGSRAACAIAEGVLRTFPKLQQDSWKYYRSIDWVRTKILSVALGGRPSGEKADATMETSASTKLPFSVLGEFAHGSATQPPGQLSGQLPVQLFGQLPDQLPAPALPAAQLAGTSASEADRESVAVPIGVLEVPIGVWGSRRVETDSGRAERVEVFAEDTCTVIVFPQGAVIRLSAGVAAGQLVVIANRKSGQIMLCRVVNVRTYPNIRGYAEIEFMHAATGFWGAYASQGILRLAARVAAAMPSASADFWSNGFAKEVVSVPASDVTASPVAPAVLAKKEPIANSAVQIPFDEKPARHIATIETDSETRFNAAGRNSLIQHVLAATPSPRASSLRASSQSPARSWNANWLFSWWAKPTARTVTYGTPVPKRSLVLVSLVPALVLLGVFGVFYLRDGVGQPAAISQTSPMPEVSLGSPMASVAQNPQPKNATSFVVPQLPIAKAENFPGAQTRALADNTRFSRPSERRGTSSRTGTSGKKITKEKLLTPYSSANRLAVMGRDAAPDVSGVDSNAGVSPLQGVLGTIQPRGGRAAEPELLVSSAPIYPAMARQARVEGQVTIDAVIDTTGKLTNMTVISGPPLLQQAALDSLRTWKYRPGYLDEKPVSTKTSITVNFRLR
jgi:TonB family protein